MAICVPSLYPSPRLLFTFPHFAAVSVLQKKRHQQLSTPKDQRLSPTVFHFPCTPSFCSSDLWSYSIITWVFFYLISCHCSNLAPVNYVLLLFSFSSLILHCLISSLRESICLYHTASQAKQQKGGRCYASLTGAYAVNMCCYCVPITRL